MLTLLIFVSIKLILSRHNEGINSFHSLLTLSNSSDSIADSCINKLELIEDELDLELDES